MTAPSTSTSPMPRSPQMPPPPPPRPPGPLSQQDDPPNSQFLESQCRYIPTSPERWDHRCACGGFSREKELPGATYHHGHIARFHPAPVNAPSLGKNQDQIDLLNQRLEMLEEQFELSDDNAMSQRVDVLEQQVGLGGERGNLSQVAPRLNQLEARVERYREESQNEVKGLYRNMSVAWLFIEDLQRRIAASEETQRSMSTELQGLQNRNLELMEINEMLEERVEKLEGLGILPTPALEPSV